MAEAISRPRTAHSPPPRFPSPPPHSPLHPTPPQHRHGAADYGRIDAVPVLGRADSAIGVNPMDQTRLDGAHRHRFGILPPLIAGHGRLLVPHRAVPYCVGVVCVVGAFSWAVFCALFIHRLGRS